MATEQAKAEPLNYAARLPRERLRPKQLERGAIVALLGAATASIGVVIFLRAHKLAGVDFNAFNPASDFNKAVLEHTALHELLWSEFGIALLLVGALVAAVGLNAWCKGRDNPADAVDRAGG